MLRKDVAIELTWDLSDLAKNDKELEGKIQKTVETAKRVAEFKGKVQSLDDLERVLKEYDKLSEEVQIISSYASLLFSADGTNTEALDVLEKVDIALEEIRNLTVFLDDEIMGLDDEMLSQAYDSIEFAKVYLRNMIKNKKNKPSYEVQVALSKLEPAFSNTYDLYETAKASDIRFEDLEVDGQKYPMTFSMYEDHYEYSSNTELRRKAFTSFVKGIKKYENTIAKNYNGHLKIEKALSQIYGFDSVFDYLLDRQDISREIYEKHIDILESELPRQMQKLATKIKEEYGLDKMTYADLKAPLMASYQKKISLKECEDLIADGLSILGEEYVTETRKYFSNRWIDLAENEGKSTGAFCSTPYGLHSYILVSWTGNMNEAIVLSHELGHAGHSRYTNEKCSALNSDGSMYYIECPSTTNELLMANYLINRTDEKELKRWVRVQMLQSTFYHNFVTHGIEAIFQREVYRAIDRGENISATKLNAMFKKVLVDFWGDSVDVIDGSELTWMRQPHYYMGLYPYTYQAGLSIATDLFKKLQSADEEDKNTLIENYKKTLSTGGLLSPVEWASSLGVEIENGKSIKSAIDFIGELIDNI